MGQRLFLPDVIFPSPTASRETLTRTAPDIGRQQQLHLVPAGTPARIVLGRGRVGGDLWIAMPHGSRYLLQCIWCWAPGGIDAIESVKWNDEPLPAGVTVAHYTGAPGQSPDPSLAAAFAALGKSYTDALENVAHSVFNAPIALVNSGGIPNLVAVVRGIKAYDSRTGLTTWTQNAAQLLEAYLAATDWGPGYAINWAASEAALDANDEQIGGRPRRTLNVVLERPAPTRARIEELRSYAACFVVHGPAGVELIPDRPKASSGSISHAAGDIQRFGRQRRRPQSRKPTLVRVRWTDASRTPWDDAASADFPPGGSEERVSEIPMPGIHDYSEALRYAAERYYRETLGDLSFDLTHFDEAADIAVGDVRDITLPWGVTAKPMQAVGRTITDLGEIVVNWSEYDPGFFSDAVGTAPSHADTSFADPNKPTPPTGLVLTEEVYQLENGTYASRIKATWTAPASYPWVRSYRIDVRAEASTVWTGTSERGVELYRTGALREGLLYNVDVYTVSPSGAISSPVSASMTAAGKSLPPGDIGAISVRELGGTVFGVITTPAVDVDIWRYEWRYVVTSGTWADATVIDRLDSLRMQTSAIPEGAWDVLCKAIDSIGQYSATEARQAVTVTLDTRAFLVGDYDLTTASTSNMHAYTLGRTDGVQRYVTDDGVVAATKFPAAAADAYTNIAASYAAAASSVTMPSASGGQDFGQELSGNWSAELTVTDIAGTSTSELGVSTDGVSFTDYSAMTAKTSGRYGRVKASGSSGTVFAVSVPTSRVRLDAITRDENGSGTSSATVATTITLSNAYSAAQSIVITPTGTAARSPVVDNVSMGAISTFDVYLFDSGGSQVASGFLWSFSGV